jgi:hypothetical protein
VDRSLESYLREFAQIKGWGFRVVSRREAQEDKKQQRRQDQAEIAAGKTTPQKVTIRNSGGLGGRMVIRDKSPAYR